MDYTNGFMSEVRNAYGVLSDTDSYKFSHPAQYPDGADNMVSYIESRGGKYDEVVFFGLQLILKEYFMQPITEEQVRNLIEFEQEHMAGNVTSLFEKALMVVVDKYDGKLPIEIRAVEEGNVVPVGNVLVTITLTVNDPDVFFLVSYFETKLMRLWSTSTVATYSYHIRKIIQAGLEKSSMDPESELPFKLNNFGSRGVSVCEASAFLSAAHLTCFQGSDSTIGAMVVKYAYGCEMAAYNIPATEHSTTTAHGISRESDVIDKMFDSYAKPGAMFATVIDSYDAIRFIDVYGPKYRERLISSGAIWVFRPDSCDPVQMPLECVRRLESIFGSVTNQKGYKVLNNVRVIQGDGIDADDVSEIINALHAEGYSLTNMAFGMGGSLLQKHNRDDQKFAQKCCAIRVNGEWRDVFKNPSVYDEKWNRVDSASFKKSKAGRLELMYNTQTNTWETMKKDIADDNDGKYGWKRMLDVVYRNGDLVKDISFDTVRNNISESLINTK